jgi:hypothetical protein
MWKTACAACAGMSKLFAGLAFSQTPPISAGLAQRLLPHYYEEHGWSPAET